MESGNPGKRRITPLERAMRLLSIRSYSERELLSKLGRAGVAVEEAQAAVTECRRRGYLNDELLAEDFAHALSARGSGARLIRLRLRNRGLVAEHVEAALEKTADLEFEAARRALDYKLRMLTRENDPRKSGRRCFVFWPAAASPVPSFGNFSTKSIFPTRLKRNLIPSVTQGAIVSTMVMTGPVPADCFFLSLQKNNPEACCFPLFMQKLHK